MSYRLADEIQRILEAEVAYPPLALESLDRVLRAIGYGDGRVTLPDIAGAVSDLVAAGQIERVRRAGRECYRVSRADGKPGRVPCAVLSAGVLAAEASNVSGA